MHGVFSLEDDLRHHHLPIIESNIIRRGDPREVAQWLWVRKAAPGRDYMRRGSFKPLST